MVRDDYWARRALADEAAAERIARQAAKAMRRVYREAAPNRYLAGFAPFLHRHRKHPAVATLLHEEFTRFFRRNLRSKAAGSHTVHFVGSIACFFAEEVGRAAAAEGFATGRILRSPIEGLRLFHGKNRENS